MFILPYYALNDNQVKTEESFFKEISKLLINKYNKIKVKKEKTPSSNTVILEVSVPITYESIFLFNFQELLKWFVKSNFKYTFYKTVPYSPKTLYIDNILISKYLISNDYNESPINKYFITSSLPPSLNKSQFNLFNYIGVLFKNTIKTFLNIFYSKNKKAYIKMEFIIREPR